MLIVIGVVVCIFAFFLKVKILNFTLYLDECLSIMLFFNFCYFFKVHILCWDMLGVSSMPVW